MPLHRQRTAPKKINRSLGLVNLNYNKIPSVFVSLVAILIVASGTVWLINSSVSSKPAPQVAAVREKRDGTVDVDPNNAKVEQKIEDQKKIENNNSNTVNSPVVTANENIKSDNTESLNQENNLPEQTKIEPSTKTDENIFIKELDCTLTFSKKSPEKIKTVAQSNQFWIPNTKCNNSNLLLVQIVSSKNKPEFEGIEVQSLDNDQEYALLYWTKPEFIGSFSIDNYLVPLTKFLTNGKLYFSVKESFDKLLLNNNDTYYLAGNCDGEGDGACVLWGLPANGSLVSLLTDKGVASTAKGQENNLQKNQYLKFAKVQDRNNRIALIIKKSNDKIDLIYIDSTKNYVIDEVRSYEKGTTGYTKYFR